MLFAFGVVSEGDAHTLILRDELRNVKIRMMVVCGWTPKNNNNKNIIYFERIQGMMACSCPAQYEPDFWISVDSSLFALV